MASLTIPILILLAVFAVTINAFTEPDPPHRLPRRVNIVGMMTLDCPKGDPSCFWPPFQPVDDDGGESVIVCEHARMTLQCTKPRKTLKIISANYGRTETEICPYDTPATTSCRASTSRQIVSQACHGKRSCELQASNSVFGDPCGGTVKYLKVHFKCI